MTDKLDKQKLLDYLITIKEEAYGCDMKMTLKNLIIDIKWGNFDAKEKRKT